MQLQEVIIKGYKSISSNAPLHLKLKKINVILGANGSGKSNIISFFKMLNYMMSGSMQSFIESNGGSQSFLHYGSKKTQNIQASLIFKSYKCHDKYDFALSYATPDKLIITSEEAEYQNNDGKYSRPKKIKLETDFKESVLSSKQEDKTLAAIRRILVNCKVYQFHDSSQTAAMRNSCPQDADNYLQAEANNLAAFLLRIKNEYPDNYNNIVSYVRLVVPQFHDFILEPNKAGNVMLKWHDNSASDYIFLPNQFSDGSIRFIALATLLLQPKNIMPSVIIIDEPELGLHPYAITQLAEMIKEASNNAQVIIATQSPYLIDEFCANDIIVVESIKEEGYSHTQLKRLNEVELKDWLDDYTISDLWDKNVIGGRPV
jgi:predicted ATPase